MSERVISHVLKFLTLMVQEIKEVKARADKDGRQP